MLWNLPPTPRLILSGPLSFNNPKAFNPSHPNLSGQDKKISNMLHYDKFFLILKFFNLKPPSFPSYETVKLTVQAPNNLFRENKNPRPVPLNPEQNRLNKSESPNNREILGSSWVYTSCDFLNERLIIFTRQLGTRYLNDWTLKDLHSVILFVDPLQSGNFTLSSICCHAR